MSHILLIDDEPAILEAVREILEMEGHAVFTASDGKQGMRLYNSHPFDLVITDILMPEQEGLETIRQLRSSSPTLKILAISGGGRHGIVEFLAIAKRLGADLGLVKPFTQQELLTAVSWLLKGKSA